MRIEQFEYLVDIYQTKSITKTAEKFFISRQVVSHAIRSLEDELGVQLLIREHDGLLFTRIGEHAVEKARKITEAYREFLKAISDVSIEMATTMKNNCITIFTISRLASTVVPSIIARYKKMFPDTSFSIITKSSKEILDIFPEDDNVIGLISYPDHIAEDREMFQLANYPKLTVYPFIESKFYICMNKNSRYNIKELFTKSDLQELPLLSYEPAYSSLTNAEEVNLNISGSIDNLSTLVELIRQDVGVGLITLNEYNKLANTKNLVLKPIQKERSHSIYFAYVLNEAGQNNVNLQRFTCMLDTIL